MRNSHSHGTALIPNVLIVDDEEIILSEYQELLEMEGIACSVEADPLRALEIVLTSPDIRVVVTDLRMPELNGVELIRRLRAELPKDRTVRFAVMSGYGGNLGAELPGVPGLEKPVNADDLVAVIRNALDQA
jgi:CheY-like chemotaxis protein